jgi:hypothetical protein
MLDELGIYGVIGILAIVAGIAVIALQDLIIAGGFALFVVGLGLTIFGVVKNMLASFGIEGLI